ncbi:MAG: prephenate dehydrogenase/arogenate dehydrogenase family protein [Verrucomicrobiota bacterium]
MRWQKISIIGVGLLGGSIGLAVRRHRLAREIAGYVRRAASLKDCEKVGAVDYSTTDLLAAVSGADLVILCTPLAQMRSLVEQMRPALKRGAIVTDVGSVKGSVVVEVESLVRKTGAHFVGSHPMAGAEKTGVLASRSDLFECAITVVTPTKQTHRPALRKVEQFWSAIGSHVMRLSPQEHDTYVSRTSHLPHVAAAALASLVLNPAHPEAQSVLCATGFRDTTRIASGSPEMWRDISLANAKNLSKALDAYLGDLKKFQTALKRSDAKAVAKFFETGKQRRDNWCACCASPSEE